MEHIEHGNFDGRIVKTLDFKFVGGMHRAIELTNGMVFQILNKGFFEWEDGLVHRVVPYLEDFEGCIVTRYKRTGKSYEPEYFNELVKEDGSLI